MDKSNNPRFSPAHGFSQAQVAEAANVVATEHRVKRLLMNVTMAHRELARRQSTVTLVLGALTMLALYLAELADPTVDRQSVDLWAAATVANIAVRTGLNIVLFTVPGPTAIVTSITLRLIPIAIVLLAAAQWVWSIDLFVGAQLGLGTFILFTGLVGISVAMVGMWPSVPLAVILYLGTSWSPFFYRLMEVDWMPGPVLLALGLGVALALWACTYLQMNQIRTILDRSDKVDLLVADLNRMNIELTRANTELGVLRNDAATELAARSLFFSSASHDFKQRLHAMKLLAYSTIKTAVLDPAPTSSLRRLADLIEDVEQYVSNVLDFARFDSIALKPDRRAINLQQLFQRLELNFEDVANASHVKLFFRTTSVELFSDVSMLQRILENLISNAVKFSRDRVLVAARGHGGSVAIEVWDQGPGINSENQQAIFRPFHQSAASGAPSGGVGLGLAVVKRFADSLGYSVTIRSNPGKGAVMTILVPAADVLQPDPRH